MGYKRNHKKEKNVFFRAVENHVQTNIKEYLIAVLIFLAGIIIGVILINNSSSETQESVTGYITEFIQSIKSNEYQIDEKKLLLKSIVSNIKIAGIIWIAGSTLIGIPIVYGTLGYKGVCMGYSISAIIATLNSAKGIVFALCSMLLQNIIAVPCILAISVSSIKMYKSIMKKQAKDGIKFEVYRHTIFSAFMTAGLIISSFVEIFISTNITSSIVSNFI